MYVLAGKLFVLTREGFLGCIENKENTEVKLKVNLKP